MHIINFLVTLFMAYWLDIVIVVAFVGLLVLLYRRGKKDLVKKIILQLVVKAEAALGSKTGELKFNEVYVQLPLIIRLFYTKQELQDFIKEAVKWLETYLGQGKNLLDYNQEAQYRLLMPEAVPSNAELNNIP